MTATDLRRRLARVPARLFLAAALAFAGFAIIGVAVAQDGAPCYGPDCLDDGAQPVPGEGGGAARPPACGTSSDCPTPGFSCDFRTLDVGWCCPVTGQPGTLVCKCSDPNTSPGAGCQLSS